MDTKTNAFINALAQQRNQALDAVAGAMADLAAVREELRAAKARIAELERPHDTPATGA